jgi:hypothetical protein
LVPGFLATATVTASASRRAGRSFSAAAAPAIIHAYSDASPAPSITAATSRRWIGRPPYTPTTVAATSSALRKRLSTVTAVSTSALAKLPAGSRQLTPASAWCTCSGDTRCAASRSRSRRISTARCRPPISQVWATLGWRLISVSTSRASWRSSRPLTSSDHKV